MALQAAGPGDLSTRGGDGVAWIARKTYAYDLVYVHHLYVRPACRGLGVGRALLDAVRKVGADLGIARLSLDVWTFNEDARAFFRRYGLMPYNERLWDG